MDLPERVVITVLLIMRRSGISLFDPFPFDAFDRLGDSHLLGVELGKLTALFQNHLVQLFVQVFEMSEVGLDFGQALREVLVHAAASRSEQVAIDHLGLTVEQRIFLAD